MSPCPTGLLPVPHSVPARAGLLQVPTRLPAQPAAPHVHVGHRGHLQVFHPPRRPVQEDCHGGRSGDSILYLFMYLV